MAGRGVRQRDDTTIPELFASTFFTGLIFWCAPSGAIIAVHRSSPEHAPIIARRLLHVRCDADTLLQRKAVVLGKKI
jgi:hypothetical protein